MLQLELNIGESRKENTPFEMFTFWHLQHFYFMQKFAFKLNVYIEKYKSDWNAVHADSMGSIWMRIAAEYANKIAFIAFPKNWWESRCAIDAKEESMKTHKKELQVFPLKRVVRHRNEEILFSESFAECEMKIRIKFTSSLATQQSSAEQKRKNKWHHTTRHTYRAITLSEFLRRGWIAVDKNEMNFNPCFSFWLIDFTWYEQ